MNKVTLKNASLLLGAMIGATTLPVLGDVIYENTSNKLSEWSKLSITDRDDANPPSLH